ncbi:sigma-70 family RNA polymerase sigma factor [Streptomyces goshikiensis]|uniref:sigma-70 family RNA polymerase sigma factor n=1 Tax=Streptomyces goshikiensis TaxID=1942 RepID=UPI0036F9008E
MPDDSTTALVLDAQRGDTWAQDRLVAHHLPLVYNIAGRALGGAHADVDDIVQDTFIRALAHLESLREPERFRAWLVVIATNRISDHWRAVQAASTSHEPLDEDSEPADPGADFVDLTILRLGLTGQRAEVAEATRWMDEDDRTLLSLWWLEAAGQLSRAEVAEAMALSPQHTAVRVQRMKERLEASRAVVRALAHEPRCAQLGELTGRWDGVPSALWRKRLARHTGACAVCARRAHGLVPAEGLLMGLALLPLTTGLSRFADQGPLDASLTAAHAPAHAEPDGADGLEVGRATAGHGTSARPGRDSVPRSRTPLVAAALVLAIGACAAGLATVAPAPDTSPRAVPAGPALPSASAAIADAASGTAPQPPASTSPATAAPSSSRPLPTATAVPVKAVTRSATPKARPRTLNQLYAERILHLINAERARAGCAPVRPDRALNTAAQAHSDDMATRGYFSHTNPEGLDSGDRIEATGYDSDGHNENIGNGYESPESVMAAWMSGGGHREAILDCAHKDSGFGYANGTDDSPRWTLLLAHP